MPAPPASGESLVRGRLSYVVWPAAAALLVRVLYLIFADQRQPHADDAFYWETAQALAQSGQFAYEGQPTVDFMPGFSLILAALIRLMGPNLEAVRLVLVCVSVATVPIAMEVAKEWFGTRVAKATGWFFALFPPFVFFSTAILTETSAIALVCVQLLLAGRLRNRYSTVIAVALGATFACLVYVKPELFALGPVYLLVSFFVPRSLSRRAAVLMLSIGLASLTPWIYRNHVVFHEFIPLKATGGVLLFFAGHHPPILELDDPRAVAARAELVVPGRPGATGRRYAQEGLRRILADPAAYVRDSLAIRVPALFIGSQTEASPTLSRSFGDLYATRQYALLTVKAALLIVQSLVCLLGFGGILVERGVRTDIPRWHFYANAAVYITLMAVPRYSMVLMPILVPHAAVAGQRLLRLLTRQRSGGADPAALAEERV